MRRDPCGPGDRVRAVYWHRDEQIKGKSVGPDGLVRDEHGDVIGVDDNVTVPPGTEGTVQDVESGLDGLAYQVRVKWDNGSALSLLAAFDQWQTVSQ